MDRIKRNERIGAMAQILMKTPNKIHTMNDFCELFGSAKSTISEDVEILAQSLKQFDLGVVETVAGAAGGVRYRPMISRARAHAQLAEVAELLSMPGRLLPGGFLYTSDISSDPKVSERMGEILAAEYYEKNPQFVLTMETKGIPIALMTARALNIPLVIARRDSKAYEGSAVKINYIAGGDTDRIETMALSRRAVSPGQRALIVDDFMKGGGTLQGMVDMMAEFQAEVVGIGVMIATAEPKKKRCENAKSLLVLQSVDKEKGACLVTPSDEYR